MFFGTVHDALVSQEHKVLFYEIYLCCFFVIRQIWSEDKCTAGGKYGDGNVLHRVSHTFKAIFIISFGDVIIQNVYINNSL